MAKKTSKKKNPKLCVMFDSSVLYTQVASDLVSHRVKELITENSSHNDLDIDWHLPNVAIGERRYQMLKKAKELLPSMQKMEKLVGHSFAIGEDSLSLYVQNAIDASIKELGFIVSDIKTSKVDWQGLIDRSINRLPPFENNEKEKGFRDSVIAHSFLQLVDSSPSTPNVCRLALVANDNRLKEYILENTKENKNVRVLANLDELESLINTLVSSIPEELATELTQKANKLFFDVGENSFYYKGSIKEKITKDFHETLTASPIEKLHKETKKWVIFEPVFIKKEKSKIHWVSPIKVEFNLYHYIHTDSSRLWKNITSITNPNEVYLKATESLISKLIVGTKSSGEAETKMIDYTGHDLFEIHWSTTLSPAKNLLKPKLEKIDYLGDDLAD
ncbi:PIN domain-containing protein [Microbulbifer sp. SSSA007]|uniref:PIN domain-containing protein n=1 Tax=Microbulbifer sp. SSSA007 TaxID=3243379 RepID=UPI004039FF9D